MVKPIKPVSAVSVKKRAGRTVNTNALASHQTRYIKKEALRKANAVRQEKKIYSYCEPTISFSDGEYGLQENERLLIEWQDTKTIFTIHCHNNNVAGTKKGSIILPSGYLESLVQHYRVHNEIQTFLNRKQPHE